MWGFASIRGFPKPDNFTYAFGNSPAKDILCLDRNEGYDSPRNLNVLQLGVCDVRDALRSLAELDSSKVLSGDIPSIHFTFVDLNSVCYARLHVFLFLLDRLCKVLNSSVASWTNTIEVPKEAEEIISVILEVWYSHLLSPMASKMLTEIIECMSTWSEMQFTCKDEISPPLQFVKIDKSESAPLMWMIQKWEDSTYTSQAMVAEKILSLRQLHKNEVFPGVSIDKNKWVEMMHSTPIDVMRLEFPTITDPGMIADLAVYYESGTFLTGAHRLQRISKATEMEEQEDNVPSDSAEIDKSFKHSSFDWSDPPPPSSGPWTTTEPNVTLLSVPVDATEELVYHLPNNIQPYRSWPFTVISEHYDAILERMSALKMEGESISGNIFPPSHSFAISLRSVVRSYLLRTARVLCHQPGKVTFSVHLENAFDLSEKITSKRYDRITTSNLCDWSSIERVAKLASPLLNRDNEFACMTMDMQNDLIDMPTGDEMREIVSSSTADLLSLLPTVDGERSPALRALMEGMKQTQQEVQVCKKADSDPLSAEVFYTFLRSDKLGLPPSTMDGTAPILENLQLRVNDNMRICNKWSSSSKDRIHSRVEKYLEWVAVS